MGVCYGVYERAGGDVWLERQFGRRFENEEEYMMWLGGSASLGGTKCIQANVVAGLALAELE